MRRDAGHDLPARSTAARGTRWAIGCLAAICAGGAWAADRPLSFNRDIRPILSENCFACHGTDANHRKGDRRLDTPEGAYADRKGFRAVVPGNLEESEVWLRIISEDSEEVMPPLDSRKSLTAEQKALIKRWIEEGGRYQKHWAYEPVVKPSVPEAAGGAGDHPVDRFIGSQLAARGLSLAPEASTEILLRRATLVLTGLPPTPAELDARLADGAPGAYEREVDRLLASPRFGEHMGRAWLDAVRYGDTHGMHLDNVRSLFPYRDWVVDAFNRNQPFDQFTVEQLAGDLLPEPKQDQLVATGYLRSQLSTSEAGTLEEEMRFREASDRTETTAAVWLGLTANCASCHDHKFDPFSQKEYYQLSAFFRSLDVPVWDGHVPVYGPHVVLGDSQQQARLRLIAEELPKRETELGVQADALFREIPLLAAPKAQPVTFEVTWAEDADTPRYDTFIQPAPPGEWREDLPVAGGRRALRLEGKVDRPLLFGGGDVPLTVRKALKAHVWVRPDPAHPPRAIGLEFIAPGYSPIRMIWGDPKAFETVAAEQSVVAGPMPLAGAYTRLEIDAVALKLKSGEAYEGMMVCQSDGVASWDSFGTQITTPDATQDPLLSSNAWLRAINSTYFGSDLKPRVNRANPDEDPVHTFVRQPSPMPIDLRFHMRLSGSQQTEWEKEQSKIYFRRFIAGPLRGALEADANRARELLAEKVYLENTLPVTLTAKECAEPRATYVILRGQYDQRGEAVHAQTPAFLPALSPRGAYADRLDLARWLVSPEQPLTARVTVNRFWQQVFGAGIVLTPGDFGSQGGPPSHAELLDWLAADFRENGWNMKRLFRLLLTSRTFRQDSQISTQLLALDRNNRWLARGPRYRLDAEVIRDQALAVSGLLVPTMGGPPVRPYQPDNIWEPVAYTGSNTFHYRRDSGPSLYRRTLYTMIKRNAPAPALSIFDAPSRDGFCLSRERTNTPMQALALMNDVQHLEAARVFAERLLEEPGTDAERLARGFRAITARWPSEAERVLLARTLERQREHFSTRPEEASRLIGIGESKLDGQAPAGEVAAWMLVGSTLLNLDEALTLN